MVLTHQFRARSSQSGLLSVPGGLTIVLLAVVVAYAETLLRPLRCGRYSFGSYVGMAVLGGAAGILLVTFSWLLGVSQPTPASVAICVVLGGGTGYCMAMATLRAAVRKRVFGAG